MMMKTTRILFVVALALTVAWQAEAKKVPMKYQLKAGDKFQYEMSTSQDIAQEVMGQSQGSAVGTSATYEFKVVEAKTDGSYTMTAALVAYSLSTTTPAGKMSYDSKTDTVVPEFAKSTAAMLNEAYTFTLSSLGKVSDVKAPDGLLDKVNKAMETIAQNDQTGVLASAGSAAATPEVFQKSLQNIFIMFPEGGAELKTPWTTEDQVTQMVVLNVKTTFELAKSSKDGNEIKVTTQITQDPGTPAIVMQDMNMTYELSGTGNGTKLIDPVTGLLKTSDNNTAISGSISIDSPQLPSPMSIPMTVRSTDKTVRK